jgi:hypothetical protein
VGICFLRVVWARTDAVLLAMTRLDDKSPRVMRKNVSELNIIDVFLRFVLNLNAAVACQNPAHGHQCIHLSFNTHTNSETIVLTGAAMIRQSFQSFSNETMLFLAATHVFTAVSSALHMHSRVVVFGRIIAAFRSYTDSIVVRITNVLVTFISCCRMFSFFFVYG